MKTFRGNTFRDFGAIRPFSFSARKYVHIPTNQTNQTYQSIHISPPYGLKPLGFEIIIIFIWKIIVVLFVVLFPIILVLLFAYSTHIDSYLNCSSISIDALFKARPYKPMLNNLT